LLLDRISYFGVSGQNCIVVRSIQVCRLGFLHRADIAGKYADSYGNNDFRSHGDGCHGICFIGRVTGVGFGLQLPSCRELFCC